MREMLVEIEEKLIELLQQQVKDLPKGSIGAGRKTEKPPCITLNNKKFTLEKADVAENVDKVAVDVEERFSYVATERAIRLKNKPIPGSVSVALQSGLLLKENEDYTVGYGSGVVSFAERAEQADIKGVVRYTTESTSSVKTLRLKAKYIIDIAGKTREEAESIAEMAVKALLDIDDVLLSEGILVTPLGGRIVSGEKEGNGLVQLAYLMEREIKVTKPVALMQKVEVRQKQNLP